MLTPLPYAAAGGGFSSVSSPKHGLPSHSALIAPPLRLAALRWRETFVVLMRCRPPSGVSTACPVADARFSVAFFIVLRCARAGAGHR
jgi:hypothetical protein